MGLLQFLRMKPVGVGSPRGVMAKVLNYESTVSKFELQLSLSDWYF